MVTIERQLQQLCITNIKQFPVQDKQYALKSQCGSRKINKK